MNKVWSLLFFIFVSIKQLSFGSEQPKFSISEKIEKIITDAELNAHLGIKVISLKTKKTIYAKNPEHLLTPASITKVFTAAAAITLLGKDYRFKTEILTDGKIIKGILNGNIYIKGFGDPSLNFENLMQLAAILKAKRIRKIFGNLIVDATFFDETQFGPGWTWDDVCYKFNSPINALSINHNCIKLSIRPSSINNKPIVLLTPNCNYVSINNEALTIPVSDTANKLKVERQWRKHKNIIEICGTIPINEMEQNFEFTIEKPELFTGVLFGQALKAANISGNGKILTGKVPESASILATNNSEKLGSLLYFMLKESDNLYAESIFKTLSAHKFNSQGTWPNSKNLLYEFLEKILGKNLEHNFVDGSGLSRYNLVSANCVIKLLNHIFNDETLKHSLLGIMPHGADGTLKKRFISNDANKKLFAKTGTLRNTSSLIGYAINKDDEIFAFSILANGIKDVSACKKLENKICRLLIESKSLNM